MGKLTFVQLRIFPAGQYFFRNVSWNKTGLFVHFEQTADLSSIGLIIEIRFIIQNHLPSFGAIKLKEKNNRDYISPQNERNRREKLTASSSLGV